MLILPREPEGRSPILNWMRLARLWMASCRLVATDEFAVVTTSQGQYYRRKTTDAGGGGSTVRQFRLKEVLDNYYRCRSWSGAEEGTDDVYIARPFEHRRGNFDPTRGGPPAGIAYDSDGDAFTATYAYTSPTKRTKTANGSAETQVLVPYFKVDFHLIYAGEVEETLTYGVLNTPLLDPAGSAITLLDDNREGRAWTKLE